MGFEFDFSHGPALRTLGHQMERQIYLQKTCLTQLLLLLSATF